MLQLVVDKREILCYHIPIQRERNIMTHLTDRQPRQTDRRCDVLRRVLATDGRYFYCEYAYFGAYFFISPHAERGVDT